MSDLVDSSYLPSTSTSSSRKLLLYDSSASHQPSPPVSTPSPTSSAANRTTATAALTRKKKSQRPTWSCTECTRRKIKCDRIVPGCSACRKRGQADLCRLDTELLEANGYTIKEGKQREKSNELYQGDATLMDGSQEHFGQLERVSTPSAKPEMTGAPLETTAEYRAMASLIEDMKYKLSQMEGAFGRLIPQSVHTDEHGLPMYENMTNHPSELFASESQVRSGAVDARLTPAHNKSQGAEVSMTTSIETGQKTDHQWSGPREADGELEAAETLEFLAMGRDRKEQHLSRSEIRKPDEPDEDVIRVDATPSTSKPTFTPVPEPMNLGPTLTNGQSKLVSGPATPSLTRSECLLDSVRSKQVVQYSMTHMLTHNGLIHPPTFLAEYADFEAWPVTDRYRLVNAAWLALYYAVLCGGMQTMSLGDAIAIGFTVEEYHRIPKLYFDASVEALHKADFMSKHSRFSVQAICVLTTAGYEAGQSDLINCLLGCAIRIAQHLQMHRLGSDSEWEVRQGRKGISRTSEAYVKSVVTRETCKRLWCTLSSDDWFTCTYRRTYAVHPAHTTTPMPLNIRDADLTIGALHSVVSFDKPTSASKLLVLHTLADRLRQLFEEVSRAETTTPELTMKIENGIDEVMSSAPKWLQPSWLADDWSLEWVQEMRQHWFISCEHKKLVLHRLCPGAALFRNHTRPYVRNCAIASARRILRHFTTGGIWPRNWTISYHTIVACTTLLLDLFHSIDEARETSSSDPEHQPKRQEVVAALEVLRRTSSDSIISARGVRLIEAMLDEEQKLNAQVVNSNTSRKRPQNASPKANFGHVAKKVATSARRHSLSSTSGSPTSHHLSPTAAGHLLSPTVTSASIVSPSTQYQPASGPSYDPTLFNGFFSNPQLPYSFQPNGTGYDFPQVDGGSSYEALESILLDGFAREWTEGGPGRVTAVATGDGIGSGAAGQVLDGRAWA